MASSPIPRWRPNTGKPLSANTRRWSRPSAGEAFPQDVAEQLWGAIAAVFESWDSDRARVYRRLNAIPGDWGTAVNVQAMVFGNMGETSATGVAFTRDPSTGERAYYGEWLVNAQGEDVVAGIRTPQYLTRAAREAANAKPLSMEEAMPEAYGELARIFELLEGHYRDMQDIEFTVERGKLWMLQTRSGKRTAKAALRMAVDMAGEGLIDEAEAVRRVDPMALDQLLHPMLDPAAPREVIARGLPASPGAASGAIVLDADGAERRAAIGEATILVRIETSPEDIHGMHAARGILTARGGMTSHAAVVARGMGRPCVSGASALCDRPGCAPAADWRARAQGRRYRHHRWRHGRSHAWPGADARARAFGRLRRADGLGRQAPPDESARQCGNPRRLPHRPPLRRRRDRPVPHRTHVLRRPPYLGGAPDDPRQRHRRPSGGAGQAAARTARRFSRDLRDHDGPSRHHPPARSAAPRIPAAQR